MARLNATSLSRVVALCATLLVLATAVGVPRATSAQTSTSSTTLPRDAFVGSYTFDSSCVPSSSCCCAQGALAITPVYADTVLPTLPASLAALVTTNSSASSNRSNDIIFSTNLDGGTACISLTNVSQVFELTSDTSAELSIPPLVLDADLSASSATSGMDTITFKNSLYPTCLSVATRASTTSTPTTTASTSTAAAASTDNETTTNSATTTAAAADVLFPSFNVTALPTIGTNPFATTPTNVTFPALTSSNITSVLATSPFETNALTAVPTATGAVASLLPTLPSLPGTTATTTSTTSNSSSVGAVSSSAANSTVQYTQQLLLANNTGAAEGSENYLAAFTVPATSSVKFVILHYYTSSDARQNNIYMNLTSSTSLAAQIISAAGTNAIPAASYFVFVQGPINVADSDQLTYSFTYSTQEDGTGATNTPFYTYEASTATATAAVVTVPSDAVASLSGLNLTDSSLNTSSSTSSTVNMDSIWNGEFETDASCVPSDTCCCGVGLINVSTTVEDPSEVLLSGNLDGGAGCLYQTSMTGLMSINSSNTQMASRSLDIPNADNTVIVFTANLGSNASVSNTSNSQLTVTNTFRSCPTVANKISSFTPASSDDTGSTTNSTDTSSGSLPRDAFVGSYEFDSSCVPSSSCCCAQGGLTISPVYADTVLPTLPASLASLVSTNSSSAKNWSDEIIFSASLDGGTACVGLSNVSQAFTLTSDQVAELSIPPLTMEADLSQSSPSSSMDTITFKNSLYPTCLSVATRTSSSTTNTSTSSNSSTTTPSTTLTDAELSTLRQSLVGDYDSSGCTVSSTCCCTSGVTTISSNSSSSSLLDVSTTLVGSGFSCLQQDGAANMVFTIVNSTFAEATPFASSSVEFFAAIQTDSNKILVSNSVHPTCPTTLTKRGSSNSAHAASHPTMSSVMAAVMLLAVATMM